MNSRTQRGALLLGLLAAVASPVLLHGAEFESRWPQKTERVWIGPEYWANPMEAWRLSGGRLEVTLPRAGQNVQVLTRQLGKARGTLEMSVEAGCVEEGKGPGTAGFQFGIRSELGDYRSALFHGRGTVAGFAPNGGLYIGNAGGVQPNAAIQKAKAVRLVLKASPEGEQYRVTLTAHDPKSGAKLGEVAKKIGAEAMVGNLALVSNVGAGRRRGGSGTPLTKHWFRNWKIGGSKVEAHDDQVFGPILWSQYTLSRRVLKMTAQMPPLGKSDARPVRLQLKKDGKWTTIATAPIDPLARTARFRLESWDDKRDTPYRLLYAFPGTDGKTRDHEWTGTIRRNPTGRELVVAGFTGNTDAAFPNARIARNVAAQDPDLLFFSGDQIYEGVGGFGIVRKPVDVAILNYLRKWYMFGWAFRDVMRDRPSISMPDDHDVYQGNIWGNGGNAITMAQHDAGGYAMDLAFVNVVHRTQTSHLPDPFDPTPIKQGITAYYCDMLYGRVSFAIIADRMFKSGPKGLVNTWKGRADHVKDPNIDVAKLDHPKARLLGQRQLKFLNQWAADWTGADMKVVLSQTIFCNLANYHGGGKMFLIADLDSNGWPQSGRNRAVEAMRQGFAIHMAGDQHLPSIVLHGIDAYSDANYSFCVPSIAVGYPRSWRPDQEGRPVRNRPEGGLANTGQYLDGLKNRVTVYAIGNPEAKVRKPVLERLHDKASGHGVLRLDKERGKITIECWRLLFDAKNPKRGDQFPGWPKTIDMKENYGRKPAAWLPNLEVEGLENPVVQVTDEATKEIVYTLRIRGKRFRPWVFGEGSYAIWVGEPGTSKSTTLKGVKSEVKEDGKTIRVRL